MNTVEKNPNLKTLRVNRDKIIINTSIISILSNILLAIFKVIAGMLSNSIAILLDAVNNISDGLGSLVTIIGTKLAAKIPNKKHPMGYGRLEYLSAMIVSALVLYAGITSLTESIKKIINPQEVEYDATSLSIMAGAVVIKFLTGQFVKFKGKKADSKALIASGSDAVFDSILSTSVLACAVLHVFFNISIEAWIGALISVFIVKAGLEMMKETVDDILGKRVEKDIAIRIKKIIVAEPGVRGAYDLLINNYGPDKNYASVHLELPDSMTVEEVDVLTRRIETKVLKETGVILTGVGVYSYNTKDDEAAKIRNRIWDMVKSHNWALQMHGFFVDQVSKIIRFDVVFSFDISAEEGVRILYAEVKKEFKDYELNIAADVDISD